MARAVDAELTIGALAAQTGCTVPTIRYYEEIGLLPAAARRASGHRVYSPAVSELLTFIRHCRDFGFSIEQVRTLLSLSTSSERNCVETREIAQAHLSAVRMKLRELRALERQLAGFVDACSAQCAGGPAAECVITQDISRGCCG